MENIALYNRINKLPNKIKEEVLDFMEFLLEKERKQGNKSLRKLGLLESSASFVIRDDFKMTDEEFLSS